MYIEDTRLYIYSCLRFSIFIFFNFIMSFLRVRLKSRCVAIFIYHYLALKSCSHYFSISNSVAIRETGGGCCSVAVVAASCTISYNFSDFRFFSSVLFSFRFQLILARCASVIIAGDGSVRKTVGKTHVKRYQNAFNFYVFFY